MTQCVGLHSLEEPAARACSGPFGKAKRTYHDGTPSCPGRRCLRQVEVWTVMKISPALVIVEKG